MSWCGNFAERYSFRIVSSKSPETKRKLCLSAKFQHQEIRWNCGILRSGTFIIYDSAGMERTKQLQFSTIYNPWHRGQIGTKLRTKLVIHQKLANFIYKKDLYVNRCERVTFSMWMCILETKAEHNAKGGILKVLKCKNEIYQKIELKEKMRKMGSFV